MGFLLYTSNLDRQEPCKQHKAKQEQRSKVNIAINHCIYKAIKEEGEYEDRKRLMTDMSAKLEVNRKFYVGVSMDD